MTSEKIEDTFTTICKIVGFICKIIVLGFGTLKHIPKPTWIEDEYLLSKPTWIEDEMNIRNRRW